jgi:hypothetical protein
MQVKPSKLRKKTIERRRKYKIIRKLKHKTNSSIRRACPAKANQTSCSKTYTTTTTL